MGFTVIGAASGLEAVVFDVNVVNGPPAMNFTQKGWSMAATMSNIPNMLKVDKFRRRMEAYGCIMDVTAKG